MICTLPALPEKWACQKSFILKASFWAALIFVYIPGSLPGKPEWENRSVHCMELRTEGKGSNLLLEGESSPRPFWLWVVVAIFWVGHLWLCLSNVPTTKWKIKHFTGCVVASLMKHLIDVLDWMAQMLSFLECNALMSEMIKMHWRILALSNIKRCSMCLYWVCRCCGKRVWRKPGSEIP